MRTEESLDDAVRLFDVTGFIVPQNEEDGEYKGQLIKAGVTVDEWNTFLLGEHGRGGMLSFDNGNVYIVEVPNKLHGISVGVLNALMAPLVAHHCLLPMTSSRWIGTDGVGREAAISYRPTHALLQASDYVTFIIEVGHSQPIGSLRTRKAAWFARYPTVHYVLLVSISAQMNSLHAELWERGVANAVQTVNFSHPGDHIITLVTRQLMDIAGAIPLPHGVGVNTQIDLDRVREAITMICL